MSKPNEYTDNFKSNFTCIFLSVRAKLKKNNLPSDTVYYTSGMSGHIECLIFGFWALYSKDSLISEYISNLVTSSEKCMESFHFRLKIIHLFEDGTKSHYKE